MKISIIIAIIVIAVVDYMPPHPHPTPDHRYDCLSEDRVVMVGTTDSTHHCKTCLPWVNVSTVLSVCSGM